MRSCFAVASILGLTVAAPEYNGSSSSEPCALISKAVEENVTKLDAKTAYECLQTVPLDVEGAALQMEGIKTIVQFQSKAEGRIR